MLNILIEPYWQIIMKIRAKNFQNQNQGFIFPKKFFPIFLRFKTELSFSYIILL